MQGLPPRGGVRRKHGSNVRVDEQEPDIRRQYRTSGQLTAKSISIKGAKRRFGDCARKTAELTPGDLLRVASVTEAAERQSALVNKVVFGEFIEPLRNGTGR